MFSVWRFPRIWRTRNRSIDLFQHVNIGEPNGNSVGELIPRALPISERGKQRLDSLPTLDIVLANRVQERRTNLRILDLRRRKKNIIVVHERIRLAGPIRGVMRPRQVHCTNETCW